ncbi:hypothetical protein [Coraliomargarita akajimensis]|uniref:Uncharacterized protein n=1 Tax=Coraliomargarita akajimensis (strain DSM 45221 / IAM 15411 / JCM 23193 / KCTC 12865 / 04OKA010-24) TaxID=583355 RepID=D5EL50_CORAD|nr:hypothetical protein [Coraliomargarita akajimensis]ADE53152.1 hypothetical protein Caka_0123 [Coraliomargarita akajimensis DSM 45221]
MSSPKHIQAQPQPNGDGYQIIYQTRQGRKVHHFPGAKQTEEPSPHAAGSYHNPEHHHQLMDRVEDYLRSET